jgi:hypothetical protein
MIWKNLRYRRGDIDRRVYRQRHDAFHAFPMLSRHNGAEEQLFIS